MRKLHSIVAVLTVLGISGCFDAQIPASEIEKSATTFVGGEYGAKIKSVKCPTELDEKPGATIKCTVTGTDGSTGRVRARATDDEGGYVITARFLDIPSQERTISKLITKRSLSKLIDRRRLSHHVKVRCQQIVPAKTHEKFACKATITVDAGTDHLRVTKRVRATVIDHTGRFAHIYIVVSNAADQRRCDAAAGSAVAISHDGPCSSQVR
jgi:hypothetical protein